MEIKKIMEHELVFNIEESDNLKPVINKMDKFGWNYSIKNNSGSGYTIHLLFDRCFTIEEKESVRLFFDKEIKKYNFISYSKITQEIKL